MAAVLIIVACNSDDDANNTGNTLASTWKFTERLADPGDGSGAFTAVESNKVLTFGNNGMVSSNGALCFMTTDIETPSTGTYSAEEGTITSECGYVLHYVIEDDKLIINYPCIEPCKAKFTKVE